MPDIPNVPGVPPLSSYALNNFVLATTDAVSIVTSLFFPQWGIYQNGRAIITPASIATQAITSVLAPFSIAAVPIAAAAAFIGVPNVLPSVASTIEFSLSQEAPISTYQQEAGAFQSYNKVVLPADIRLRLACGGGALLRQAFFGTIQAILVSTSVFDINTPEGAFTGYNCKHVDWSRRADRGVDLVQADVWFEQVRIVSALSFSDTKSPTVAGAQGLGNVQPQTPTDANQQQFDTQSASQGLF